MPESKEKNIHPVGKALSNLTGFPIEGLCDIPVLLCKGTMEVQVEGCRSILEYGDTRVKLNLGKEMLTVTGSALALSDFHRNCLTVRGQITTLSWEV